MRHSFLQDISAAARTLASRAFLAVSVGGALLSVLPVRSAAANAATATESGSSQTAARALHPLIVNGRVTSAYPATGALLLYGDAAGSSLYGACSGILIGCRTFLTAAHCVCPEDTSDAAACEREGRTDPATLRVFLQQGGIVAVASVAISPDYSFAIRGDVAVITLAESVTGIAPSALNTTRRPDLGTVGTIVGFGTTASGRGSTNDSGIKREGAVTTARCPWDISSDTHVCWEFGGSGANSCEGDSGGPLFVDFGSGPVIAGVTSGGHSLDCLAPDTAFDSDVFVNRSWIAAIAGADLGTESCALPAAGTALTTTFTNAGELSSSQPEARLQFDVGEGAAVLRIGLNAQIGSGSGFFSELNDYDLFVRAGSAPTVDAFDCADANPTPFGFCEINAPRPGTWHVLVRLNQGAGAFQVTATTFAAASALACAGDCNGDGSVTIDEVLTAVGIALGNANLGSCASSDANGDGAVTIDEVIAAVTYALNGCPKP